MRLSPDEIIFWQYGFFKLNATMAFTWGLMLVLDGRFNPDHAQAVHRSATVPLAESAGNRRHRHRETN
jgi:hypothetical protein